MVTLHVRAASALLVLGALCLLAAVAGGLLRAGVGGLDSQGAGLAAAAHAVLMMSGFLGTVIAIERAVAVKLRWAFVAPALSALGGLLMLAGQWQVGAWVSVLAAAVFVAVNGVVVVQQAAAHTALMGVGALAWLSGNLMLAAGRGVNAAMPWWFAFLVLTIAAERLEMTRLTRRHSLAQPSLVIILATLLSGAALAAAQPMWGGLLYGSALVSLAVWLALFDIARHTVRAHGLSRYMALCLLAGYAWLAVAGVAWTGMAVGCPGRDMALHALGLGFVISMVMGHAPVILPAVARIKLQFGPWFYLPLAMLHASLALRLFGGFTHPALRALGAALNAVSLGVFMLTVLASALVWRMRHGAALAARMR